MSFPYSYDDLRCEASDRSPKQVVLFTDVDFWIGGAGHRMRISALINYLCEHVQLAVVYTGNAPHEAAFGRGYDIVFIETESGKSDRLGELLREALPNRHFEAAIIEYIHNSYCLACLSDDVKRILDAHDIISERAESFAAFNYAGALFEIPADLEYELFDQYDHIVVLTKRDAGKIGVVIGEGKALVCPHPAAGRRHIIQQRVKNIGFIASEYLPNFDGLSYFLRECWPHLQNSSDINLLIYGNVVNWFRRDPVRERVVFKGFVPDLNEFYDQVDIVINPVRFGAGLKIKNVEAMANGLPLLTTTHGATGLEAAIGKALLVADCREDFISCLHLLIENYPLRQEMGMNGYHLASTVFSPEACFEPLLKVI